MRILAHFIPGPQVRDIVAPESDWLDIRWCAADDDATFHRELPHADVLWHVLRPLSAADLRCGRRLRLVHKFGVGINTVDVDEASRRGIAVANMPGANAASVAEATVLLMLAVQRRLLPLDTATRELRGWPTDPDLGEHCRDVGGCTVGLVGFGSIAQRVARIVAAMGATVLHTTTGDDGMPGWRPLPELLATADIVSLHVPLTPATEGLIGRAALARMKPHAVLVNTARGPIVDEPALAEALASGRLAGAGLDVFDVEPVPADNPLLGLPNVVLSPHVSWYTADTMRRYLAAAMDNCRRLRDGQTLSHVVNQPTGC